MEYDFSSLNDRDFEALSLDLLAKHFQTRIERFKPGKDGGVDGRWFASNGKEIVVQCKHWAQSGVDRLISHMAGAEKKKLDKIRPTRYLLATSVPLSRANKARLVAALSPYVLSPKDIFGREDLHDLLVAAPEIEGRHPKLWIATSTVFARLLSLGLVNRSGFAIEQVRSKAKRYVETADAERARQKLGAGRVLILKGAPGVGKTTLAQQLLLEAVGRNFECYVLDSIEEAESVFDDERKQFFLFDDFLGGNLLEVMHGRQDSKIVAFIKRVLAKPDKYFVLTSRSHILEQGKDCSEAFRHARIHSREFELSVGNLSDMDKARILYSHMAAGEMPQEAVDAIYESRRYMYVIKHRNFNPRLVEFITDPDLLSGLDMSHYWSHVEASFESPQEVWGHVFNKQLSADVRALCHLVGFNGRALSEDELKSAFRRYCGLGSVADAIYAQRFHDALRLATGSVLNRTVGADGASLMLFNPSIGDYLLGIVPAMGLIVPIFSSLHTVSSLAHLDTLVAQQVASNEDRQKVLTQIAASPDFACEADIAFAVEVVVRLLRSSGWLAVASVANELVKRFAPDMPGHAMEDALAILERCVEASDASNCKDAIHRLLSDAHEVIVSPAATRSICRLSRQLDRELSTATFPALSEIILEDWRNNVAEFVTSEGVIDDVMSESDAGLAEEQVFDYVMSELSSFGIEIDVDAIQELVAEVDVRDIIRDNQSAYAEDRYDDHDDYRPSYSPDAAIHDYFDRS